MLGPESQSQSHLSLQRHIFSILLSSSLPPLVKYKHPKKNHDSQLRKTHLLRRSNRKILHAHLPTPIHPRPTLPRAAQPRPKTQLPHPAPTPPTIHRPLRKPPPPLLPPPHHHPRPHLPLPQNRFPRPRRLLHGKQQLLRHRAPDAGVRGVQCRRES